MIDLLPNVTNHFALLAYLLVLCSISNEAHACEETEPEFEEQHAKCAMLTEFTIL